MVAIDNPCLESADTAAERPRQNDENSRKTKKSSSDLQYGVEDVPAPHLCFLFGLQQVLLSISSTISVPLVVSINICAGDLALVKSQIMSTFLFMCGVCTILQCTLGVRLPILQGGCHKFLPAIAALMSLGAWKCPDMGPYLQANSTLDAGDVWKPRIREIQGGIMVASVIQILIGCTGILGIILQYLGPITIVPTISLVGLSLVDVALRFCKTHWGMSALTVGLLLLFSLYLRNVTVPLPAYSRQERCHIIHYPLFKLIPVILAVVISWSLCALLTLSDVAPESIRTNTKSSVLDSADWFFFPYPGQWGMPTVSVAGIIAMLAVTISSIIESVGDYYACARISDVPPPPAHAINRGIAIEGLGSLISGAVGSGGATTSYSQNVGAIGFTRVASRSAFIMAGVIFLVAGLIGKVGAFLTTMPDPVLGGIVLVSFGMVTSVGLSALSFVDLSSTRNMTIIGTSLLVGLMVPRFLEEHPDAINTGNNDLDRALKVLLGTAMFVGGVMAFILDNSVPGTVEERGIEKWRNKSQTTESTNLEKIHVNGRQPEHPVPQQRPPCTVVVKDLELSNFKGDSPDSGIQEHLENNTISVNCGEAGAIKGGSCNSPLPSIEQSIYDLPFITPYLMKLRCARYWPFLPSFAYTKFNTTCKTCKERVDNRKKTSAMNGVC